MDELDQGQTYLRVLIGRQGTSQEKMDSAELQLHTDPDGAWITSQTAEVWISGEWRLRLHSVRSGHGRTRQIQRVQEAIERKGTNG